MLGRKKRKLGRKGWRGREAGRNPRDWGQARLMRTENAAALPNPPRSTRILLDVFIWGGGGITETLLASG